MLGQFQDLVKGDSENFLLRVDPSRGFWGHASLGYFEK